ncbi:DUF4179 domain-containing protein [Psychrobacillus sp.]|uniref:DUF4179 domain-containing protein n=1 Tax=Psychrobacillus sp. TaxID=1871623 RepID=UPI0028BE78D8|nr:DUF4179 domain-containing protein [Psychrobacillus sp.]
MDKWEQFLTDKQKDELPESVELSIQKAFKQLPTKKVKAKTTGIVAAAVLFLSLVVGSFFSPTMAATLQSIPVVGSLFEWLHVADEGIKTSVKQGISEDQNIEFQIEGNKIIVEETMFDGSRLAISFIVQANSQKEASQQLYDLLYKINDTRSFDWGRWLQVHIQKKPVSDGYYAGVYILKTQKPLPEEFNFSIKTDSSWVHVPVTSKGEHTVFDIQVEKQNEGLSILYQNITFYPSTTILSFEEKQSVEHYISLRDKQLIYTIFDENGNSVPIIFVDGEGGEYINKRLNMRYSYFLPTREDPYKKLTIVPTVISTAEGQYGEVIEILEDFSFTIDLTQQ